MTTELVPNDQCQFVHMINDGNKEKEISCYQGGSFVSGGGFGRCNVARKYKGIHNDKDPNHLGQVVIIKTMKKDSKHNSQKIFMNEVTILNILRATRSKYFDNIYESWQDRTNYYIVLEKGDLSLHELMINLGQLDENEILYIIQQILRALQVLHRQRIIHRDIKPPNIIMNIEANIKLIDFGLSKIDLDKDPKDCKRCGTPNFMSPQIIMATDKNQYSYQVDIWSAGILLHLLMKKNYPYNCNKNQQIQKLIKDKIIPFIKQLTEKQNKGKQKNKKSFELLQKMLAFDKNQRPTAGQLLQDNYFHQINIQETELEIKKSLKQKIQLYLKNKKKQEKWSKNIILKSITLQKIDYYIENSNRRVIVINVIHQSQYGHFLCLSNGSKFAYFNDETILRHGKACNLNDSKQKNKKNILDKIVNQKFMNAVQFSGGEQSYVVKIVKTRQALFVRLSNHTFQVFFVRKFPKNQQRQNQKTNAQYSCAVYTNYNLLNPAEICIANFIQGTQQFYLNFQLAKQSSSENRNRLVYINNSKSLIKELLESLFLNCN